MSQLPSDRNSSISVPAPLAPHSSHPPPTSSRGSKHRLGNRRLSFPSGVRLPLKVILNNYVLLLVV